jgi:23S rRNA (cytosine1962-C5)-methyltransferase
MKKTSHKRKIVNHKHIIAKSWESYTLLDSGKGRKLERFGNHVVIRPEPRAIWKPVLAPNQWGQSIAEYKEMSHKKWGWEKSPKAKDNWDINYNSISLSIETKNSRQMGVFPENAAHWDWISPLITVAEKPFEVLNLFGYTGIASLIAAKNGANVTHIDSSRHAIRLGKSNQKKSGLESATIRWIEEDVSKFVSRAIKRGTKYQGIILDPPAFGLGPKKEKWEFDQSILPLCKALNKILADDARFVILTAYAIEYYPEELVPLMESIIGKRTGTIETGLLTLPEESAGRQLDLSITARWKSDE